MDISFHDIVIIIIIIISTLTVYIILDLFLNKFLNLFLLKNHNIEIIWTIIPIIIILIICFPSWKIIYLIDEIVNPFFSQLNQLVINDIDHMNIQNEMRE